MTTRDISQEASLKHATRSPPRFIRTLLQRATFTLSPITEVDVRDDCAREIAVAACAAGFAQMGEVLAAGIDDQFQRCWARIEIAFIHATLRRSDHARRAIRVAKAALYETPADDPVPCDIISLLARACAEVADADGFDEIAHLVPTAVAATNDAADQVEALGDLAVGSQALGESVRAMAWFADAEAIARSVAVKPDDAIFERLALAYAKIGDDVAAIRTAERATKFLPSQARLFGRLALAATARRGPVGEYARRGLDLCRHADWDTNPGCYDAAADVATAAALIGDFEVATDAIAYLQASAPVEEAGSYVARHASALAVARAAFGWPRSSNVCLRAFGILEQGWRWPDSYIYDLTNFARRLAVYQLHRGAALCRL